MAIAPESQRLLVVVHGLEPPVVQTLTKAGYQVAVAETIDDAREQLALSEYDAVVFALASLGAFATQRVTELKRAAGSASLLVVAGADRLRSAARTMRHGVEDYVPSPTDPFDLRTRLERLLERRELDSRVSFLQEEISKRHALGRLEARSPAMREVLDRILRVAPTRSTVLITGESGVGKELVARAIHFNSPRRDHPFIALNCAAISSSLIESELFGHERGSFTGAHARVRGKFEIAHSGTLFLDEIGEMIPETQVKLLRVLEEQEFMRVGGDRSVRVNVRVLAATNADLESMVARERFRRDLYYRLKVVTVPVPPLRRRRADLPHLVQTFLEELARANAMPLKSISPEALAALADYQWPGNVRELKNMLESLLVSAVGSRIDAEDLPAPVRGVRSSRDEAALTPGTTLAEMESELIRRTLDYTGGNRTHSAELLGIGVRTLQRKIVSYKLSIPPRRRRRRSAN